MTIQVGTNWDGTGYKEFTVMIDTSDSNFWLPSSNCTSPGCACPSPRRGCPGLETLGNDDNTLSSTDQSWSVDYGWFLHDKGTVSGVIASDLFYFAGFGVKELVLPPEGFPMTLSFGLANDVDARINNAVLSQVR
jgi:Eukaryotic aspartyl protease